MQSELIPFSKSYLLSHASRPVTALLDEVGLLDSADFPTAGQLNDIVSSVHDSWRGPVFKGQSTFDNNDTRYYETIISEDNVVPTRENSWHDLFNALIWLQFPESKKRLNALHINDIECYGVNPRTARRNRITHFDECGVVLAVEQPEATDNIEANRIEQWLTDLAHHRWQTVFVDNVDVFRRNITPIVFGHANLEMMLNPFIGLTGKWLAVSVPAGFSKMRPWQQRKTVDSSLVARITALDDFELAPLLKPLPLLGVPGWHHSQDSVFYQNTAYFRPLRQHAKPTVQLPLWV
ncbi:hypothetical protein KUL152_01400 [Tenacibaculum sp. KUL152]|nr:hypothetical protein KUL152_01400 [Tenacibaculum sp. KUL152]